MRKLVMVSTVLLLSACSTAPKPPVVDGSKRHAVNTPETAEVVALRAQLAQSEEQLRVEQSRPVVSPKALQPAVVPGPKTFTVLFPYNNTQFRMNEMDKAELRSALFKARRIEVRGRTDGQRPNVGDERVALNRALAAQRFLIGEGVPPALISVNYVSAGDYIADNATSIGQARNRRVEIVIFNR